MRDRKSVYDQGVGSKLIRVMRSGEGDDQALSISRFIAGGQFRAGAANIDDPQALVEVRNSNLRVIDITNLATRVGAGHDRFAAFASIYGRLPQSSDGRVASDIGPGVYELDVANKFETLDARLVQQVADPTTTER